MDTQVSRMTAFDNDIIRELFEKADVSQPDPNPAFFEDDRNIMLVARSDGELSGFMWGYVLASPDRHESKMYLYSIDTFEPFRRHGIATAMIQRFKEIALSYNCYKMTVPTNIQNHPAIGLYQKTGGVATDYGGDLGLTWDKEALHS